MATIELWPQWLTFLNIPHGDLLPCKFEWGIPNFSFPTLFDPYRELLLRKSMMNWLWVRNWNTCAHIQFEQKVQYYILSFIQEVHLLIFLKKSSGRIVCYLRYAFRGTFFFFDLRNLRTLNPFLTTCCWNHWQRLFSLYVIKTI